MKNALVTAITAAALASPILTFGTAAQADIRVLFREGAPKDSFELRNTGACALGPMEIVVDLTGSAGSLIFDTQAQGPGVEVYQPFELVQGASLVRSASELRDGGRAISLSITGLSPRQAIAFTIDVDDTLTESPLGQTRVAGSEIKGAKIVARFDATAALVPEVTAQFTRDAVAVLPISSCLS